MSSAAKTEASLPRLVILNPNFLLLWAAAGISAVGDHLSEFALLKQLGGMERDDTTRIRALMQFGFFLPFPFIAPLAGWWADKFSRKWTMFGSDILRGVVMLSLIWAVPTMLAAGFGTYTVVVPLAMAGFLAAFFSPARQALLPDLVKEDQLVRANAMISALGTIASIVSYGVGGWLAKHYSPSVNYQLDALTFGISAVLVASILMSRARPTHHSAELAGFSAVTEGFRYVLSHRRILQMILLGTVFWAAAGAVNSMIPAIVRDVFAGDLADIGKYQGVMAIGLAAGAALMTIVGPKLPIPTAVMLTLFGAGFWVAVLCGAVVGHWPWWICATSFFFIGMHGAGLLITVMATIQRFVPDSRRGRVCGVSDMMTMGAMVTASGAIGLPNIPGLDRLIPYLLGVVAAGLLLAGVAAATLYSRRNGRIVARAAAAGAARPR